MAESKKQAHRRLQKRTNKLKAEHAALDRDRVPFDQADHDAHTAHLLEHKRDLADHKARPDDKPGDNEDT